MRAVAAIIAGALVFSASVSADTSSCDAFSLLARNIMSGRQNGVTMKQQMQIMSASEGSEAIKDLMKNLIIGAYEQPGYSTEPAKQRAIDEYENQFYLACTKGS